MSLSKGHFDKENDVFWFIEREFLMGERDKTPFSEAISSVFFATVLSIYLVIIKHHFHVKSGVDGMKNNEKCANENYIFL